MTAHNLAFFTKFFSQCFIAIGHLWKLEGTKLTNIWKPNEKWKLKPDGNFVYVEKILDKKVLGITDGNTGVEEVVPQNTAKQLWKNSNPVRSAILLSIPGTSALITTVITIPA